MPDGENTFIYVVPREGARIMQPNRNGRAMPIEGDYVDTNDVYYVRLINSGDLVKSNAPSASPKETRKSASK